MRLDSPDNYLILIGQKKNHLDLVHSLHRCYNCCIINEDIYCILYILYIISWRKRKGDFIELLNYKHIYSTVHNIFSLIIVIDNNLKKAINGSSCSPQYFIYSHLIDVVDLKCVKGQTSDFNPGDWLTNLATELKLSLSSTWPTFWLSLNSFFTRRIIFIRFLALWPAYAIRLSAKSRSDIFPISIS